MSLVRSVLVGAILTTIGMGQSAPGQPRSLSDRELQNLEAFARLFGYIRYFHPTGAVATANWEEIAIHSVPGVLSAGNSRELAAALTAAFAPVTEGVSVVPTGTTVPPLALKPGPYLIEWRHHGVGLTDAPPYYSERVTRRTTGDPGEIDTITAELPGGALCRVPRVLYTETPGVFRLKPLPSAQPVASPADRSVRLAAVIIAWNVMQHFYPYFPAVHTDWPQALTAALKSAATDTPVQFLSTLRRMMVALHDGHGRVTLPWLDTVSSPVGWDWVEGRLIVTDVPAWSSGITRGDAVLSINGRKTADALAAAEAEIPSATPQWLLARALGTALHYNEPLGAIGEGPPSEPLALEIEPFDSPGVTRKVSVERKPWRPVVEVRPQPIGEIEPGIIYMDLSRASSAAFKAELPRMQQARGLIFDLRGYPNSELGIDYLQYLSPGPMSGSPMRVPIVSHPDHRITQWVPSAWPLPPIAPRLTARTAFLTNGRAISFSESIMAVVEGYRLGDIVGGPTAGTNGNTNTFSVPGGYKITWSGMKVLKTDGSQLHGVGIAPTVPAARTRAGVAAGRDEILERALSLFK